MSETYDTDDDDDDDDDGDIRGIVSVWRLGNRPELQYQRAANLHRWPESGKDKADDPSKRRKVESIKKGDQLEH